MIKVIDCFIFYDEFLLLDIRLRELADIVDKFVIIEATETFTGIPKPLYLSESISQRYPDYLDKIDVIVAPSANFDNAWDREFFQKNHHSKASLGYLNLDDNDLILLSDVDEIPRRDVILGLKHNGYDLNGGSLEGPLFYYKFNTLTSERWDKAKYISYGNFIDHVQQRFRSEINIIPNSMWHFSYLKTPEKIQEKLNAFSHQEFNNESYNTIENITRRVEGLSDLFDRPEISLSIVEIDESFPEYVKENKANLLDWIANSAKVGLGIPTINRLDLLQEALEVYENLWKERPVVIVDNGPQAIEESWFKLHVPRTNLGVSGSWNHLIKNLLAQGCTHVVIMNDDIIFDKTPEEIEAFIQSHPAGFYKGSRMGEDWSVFVISKETFKTIGEFSPLFWPAYFEDNDYEYRMQLAGTKVISSEFFNPVVFRNSQTIAKNPELNKNFNNNFARYVEKWGGPPRNEQFKTPYNQ